MEQGSNIEGYIKWGVLAVGVIALECVGSESLTHYAHKATEHRFGKWAVPAIIGVTAMHLMDREHDILPEGIDAFHIIARTLEDRRQQSVEALEKLEEVV